jgi:hypothetical protein
MRRVAVRGFSDVWQIRITETESGRRSMTLYIYSSSPLCSAYSPTTVDGETIGGPDSANPSDVANARVELWDRQSHHFKKQPFPDHIAAGEQILVISGRARSCLQQLSICSQIRFTPATIVSFRSKRLISKGYFLMYSTKNWDILDYERSDILGITGDDGQFTPLSVRRWVVRACSVPDTDLFYAQFNSWFVKQSVKVAFERSGILGYDLSEIVMSG